MEGTQEDYSRHAGPRVVLNSRGLLDRFWTHLLERRTRGSLNKEDAVRYAFFHALTSEGHIHPADIHLETPHPALGGHHEVDLLVPATAARPGLLVEFKFDRRRQQGHVNRTDRVAAAFFDLYRLGAYHPSGDWERLFIYLTEGEMAGHFRSPTLGLRSFFDDSQPLALGALLGHSQGRTFGRRLAGLTSTASVELCYRADAEDLHLRVYRVQPGVTP